MGRTARVGAWGASRVLDYFETDKAVDAKRVGVEGHSRYGKATVVAMAYDQRFAIAYISSSGAGGVKLHRRNWGELVENVAGSSEYRWMAGNYLRYAGPLTWNDMPVDSHELVARDRRRMGGREGHVPRRSWSRTGVQAVGTKGPRHQRIPSGRNDPDRWRRGVPSAQRRPYRWTELADV